MGRNYSGGISEHGGRTCQFLGDCSYTPKLIARVLRLNVCIVIKRKHYYYSSFVPRRKTLGILASFRYLFHHTPEPYFVVLCWDVFFFYFLLIFRTAVPAAATCPLCVIRSPIIVIILHHKTCTDLMRSKYGIGTMESVQPPLQ